MKELKKACHVHSINWNSITGTSILASVKQVTAIKPFEQAALILNRESMKILTFIKAVG